MSRPSDAVVAATLAAVIDLEILADAARGRVPVSRAAELLHTGDRRMLSPKAPAKGLTLLRVGYGPETP